MTELYIFSSSLGEFLRFKRIAWWLLIVAAVSGVSWTFVNRLPNIPQQDAYVLLSAALVFRILPLCAAIYSTAVVNQEVSQRTIVYLLTRPIPRWKLLVFRTLAATVVVFLISALAGISVSMSSKGISNPLLVRDLEAILAGAAAYTTLFTFVSLLINRSMVVCLLFAFVWETAVPNMPGDLYRLSISGYLTSIAQRPASTAPSGALDALAGLLGVNIIPPATAWTTMAILTAACMLAGAYWFSHFEYMAREDGE